MEKKIIVIKVQGSVNSKLEPPVVSFIIVPSHHWFIGQTVSMMFNGNMREIQ